MGQRKGDKGKIILYIIMLALFPNVTKFQLPKALKIDIFVYPTVL